MTSSPGPTRRRLLTVAGAAGIGSLLAACGESEPAPDPEVRVSTPATVAAPPSRIGPTVAEIANGSYQRPDVDVLVWTDERRADAIRPRLQEWARTESVEVLVQSLPGGVVNSAAVYAWRRDQGPDLLLGPHNWVGGLEALGAVEPVPWPDGSQEDLHPVARGALTVGGEVLGLPLSFTTTVALAPSGRLSAETRLDGLVLEDRDADLRFVGAAASLPILTRPVFASHGASLLSAEPDAGTPLLDEPASVAAGVTLGRYSAVGAVQVTSDPGAAIDSAAQGGPAVVVDTGFLAPRLEELGDCEIRPVPAAADAAPPAAWSFIESVFLLRAERAAGAPVHRLLAELHGPGGLMDVFTDALRLPTISRRILNVWREDPAGARRLLIEMSDVLESTEPAPVAPETAGVLPAFGTALCSIVAGQDPSDALQVAQQKAERLLS